METAGWTDVLVVSSVLLSAFVLYRVIKHKRKVGGNPELWGTVFEALTHYVQPQGVLKEPKQHINKQKRNDGEDLDGNDKNAQSD